MKNVMLYSFLIFSPSVFVYLSWNSLERDYNSEPFGGIEETKVVPESFIDLSNYKSANHSFEEISYLADLSSSFNLLEEMKPFSKENTTSSIDFLNSFSPDFSAENTDNFSVNSSGFAATVTFLRKTAAAATNTGSHGFVLIREASINSAQSVVETKAASGTNDFVDPGGDFDIVFLPVTDGFLFLLFLCLFYSLLLYVRKKSNLV